MKILLCSVPNGTMRDTLSPLMPRNNHWIQPQLPVGILRLIPWMEKNGYYGSDIYDINDLRPSDEKLIEIFKRIKPTVVGLSGPVSHCYPSVKRITKILRELFPDIWIVVGGHVTSSSNVILHKTETDICVVGDGEIPFVKLLNYFKLHPTRRQFDYTGLYPIKGLAFIDDNSKLKVTGNAEQLSETEMQYPDLDKLRSGFKEFGGNGELIHEFFSPITNLPGFIGEMLEGKLYPEGLKFYKKNINKTIGEIMTVRGCVARCTFCQRYTKGYRVYAPNDLEAYVTELKEKYNIGGLQVQDENFGSNKKQSYEFARIMKKLDLFWNVGGVRVKSVTYEDLKFYKEHNMVAIRFGIESGSQKILDVMEKKFTTEDVYKTLSNCRKVGLPVATDMFMLGMPGETRETVIQSAQFVAELKYLVGRDWKISQPMLAMAIPGTPLYEYCQQIGVIGKKLEEEEEYLYRMSEHKNTHILNYVNQTNSSIKEVHYWLYLFHYAGKKAYLNLIIKKNKSIKNRLLQIYELCIKCTFEDLIDDFNIRKKSYKNKKLLQKTKWLIFLSINFLLSLSVLFLPKAILFRIIKVYAGLRFYTLTKKNKYTDGKQRHNLFVNQRYEPVKNSRMTEDRIAKTSRQVERSLRSIVMDNRKQMKPSITNEEKGLQTLAEGQ